MRITTSYNQGASPDHLHTETEPPPVVKPRTFNQNGYFEVLGSERQIQVFTYILVIRKGTTLCFNRLSGS